MVFFPLRRHICVQNIHIILFLLKSEYSGFLLVAAQMKSGAYWPKKQQNTSAFVVVSDWLEVGTVIPQ